MLLEKERQDIIKYSKMLVTRGLTRGTGGNISILDRAQKLFAISPSGIDYFDMQPDDIVILNLDGDIIQGTRKPSSELAMHRLIYRERPEFAAVVHTHSPFATALSCTGQDLPPVSYLVALAGPDVRCAPYATFGTERLAQVACKYMHDRKAVLLANHGLLAAGENINTAFTIAEQLEFCCEILCHAKNFCTDNTNIKFLTQEQIRDAQKKFGSYGQASDEWGMMNDEY